MFTVPMRNAHYHPIRKFSLYVWVERYQKCTFNPISEDWNQKLPNFPLDLTMNIIVEQPKSANKIEMVVQCRTYDVEDKEELKNLTEEFMKYYKKFHEFERV